MNIQHRYFSFYTVFKRGQDRRTAEQEEGEIARGYGDSFLGEPRINLASLKIIRRALLNGIDFF